MADKAPKWASAPEIAETAQPKFTPGPMNIEPPTPIERVGRGFADFTEGATQAALWIKDQITGGNEAEQYTKEKTADLGLYEQGRGPDAGVDWWRLTGNVAAATPASLIPGGATLGAAMKTGAAVGAGTGGLMFTPEGGSKAAQVILGGAAGAAAPVVADALGAAAGRVAQTVRELPGRMVRGVQTNLPASVPGSAAPSVLAGEVSKALQSEGVNFSTLTESMRAQMLKDAEAMFRATGKIDGAALARKQAIESVAGKGMATTAQITRNPQQWTRERNLQKVTESEASRRITSRYEQQDQGMKTYAETIAEATGGKAATPFDAAEKAVADVKKVWDETGDSVSAMYELARKTFGAQTELPTQNFSVRVTSALEDFSDVMPEPVARRLAEFGFSRMGPVKPTKAFTVEEGDKLLKLVNRRYTNGKDATTDAALGEVRAALKGAMEELGESGNQSANAFRESWYQASKRFQRFEAKPLADAVEGKIDSSKFIERYVLGGNPKELESLLEVVKSAGGNSANDLRGQVWDWVIGQATSQGRGAFNGTAFDDALRKIGPERINILFPKLRGQIDTLRRASLAMTREPPFAAPNRSNTASTLMNTMLRYGPDMPFIGPWAVKPVQSAAQNVQASSALAGNVVDDAASSVAAEAKAQTIADLLRRAGLFVGPSGAANLAR